ncbi:unnamed protein product [Hyaloperonospora brassicae]|uniref:BZIP domain-containing protein n=1 Tax=Hyaloperonospora brassicae TaxID=162125 RepID=A0AAV0SX11_HYABA|nr:unnamed protein product [Hyaloperonospora brassicae]
MQQQQDDVGVLDDDLLAELADVLSFESSPSASAFGPTEDSMGSILGDDMDLMLSIDIPSLPDVKTGTHEVAILPCKKASATKDRAGAHSSGKAPKEPLASKGKDARSAPYSKANKQRRRKRPKDELDYLRAKVADMERELQNLQLEPGEGSSVADNNAALFSTESRSSQSMLMSWQRIAERQKKEVDRSIVENLRLRAMLEGQLSVARSLEAAIDQHQRDAAQSISPFHTRNGSSSLLQFSAMSEELIFACLAENLKTQYAELDSVFEQCGITHVDHDMNNGTTAHTDASGVSVRHVDVRLLPFSPDTVHQAMWGILRHSTAKEMMMGPFQTQVIDDNRMNVSMVETIELGKFRTTNIVRRFSFWRVFEKDRTVILWSSYVEMDGSISVRLRDKGYTAFSSYNFGTDSFGVGVPGSVTRMVVLATPELTTTASLEMATPVSPVEGKSHIGELTELVVGTYRVSMGLVHQMIDTLLLRDAMGGKAMGDAPSTSSGSPVVT